MSLNRAMSSFDLPTWIANDAQKIENKPGLKAAHERMVLAGEALDALLIVHAGCRPSLCPTISAYQRVLLDHGYKGEARFGEIGEAS